MINMSVAVKIPEESELSIRVEFSSKVNVTPFVARQEVDDFLLNEVGNLLYGEDPELLVDREGVFWRVPVAYALPSCGKLGTVGYLLVDVQSGEVCRSRAEVEEVRRNAEALHRTHASETTGRV